MKTLVELLWVLVAFCAFLAVLYALRQLNAGVTVAGAVMLGVLALVCATWFTHWGKR